MSAVKVTAPVSLAFAQATALNQSQYQSQYQLEDAETAALELADQLWLSLSFPQLALEAVAKPGQRKRPCVVFEERKNQLLVFAASESAAHAGVAPGMSLSAAKALCATLEHYKRRPELELKLLQKLAGWARQYTPVVSLLGVEALALEIKYSLRLFDGLRTLCEKIQSEFNDAWDMQLSWAVAPTPLAAFLLASNSKTIMVTHKRDLRSVLGKLSVSQVGLEDKLVRNLMRMGVQRLQDVWRLPRGGLMRRLGKPVMDYLDKVLGIQADLQQSYAEPQQFRSEIDLPAEISEQKIILQAVQQLLDRLVIFLRGQDASTDAITIELYHTHQPVTMIPVNLRYSTRDAHWLSDLVHEHFNRTVVKEAVVAVGLTTNNLLCFQAEIQDLFADQESEYDEADYKTLCSSIEEHDKAKNRTRQQQQYQRKTDEVLQQMQARLGDTAVKQVSCVADHRPECAWEYVAQLRQDKPGRRNQRNTGKTADTYLPGADRPFWLLSDPLSLSVTEADKTIQYKRNDLSLVSGPERVQAGWWDDNDVQRDYYVATDAQGRRLWVYEDKQRPGHWYLHGLFG